MGEEDILWLQKSGSRQQGEEKWAIRQER